MANNPVPMDDASANSSGSNSDSQYPPSGTQSGFDNEAEAALGFMAARVRLQRKLAGLSSGSALDDEAAQSPEASTEPPAQPPSQSLQSFQPPSLPVPPLGQGHNQSLRQGHNQSLRQGHNQSLRQGHNQPPSTLPTPTQPARNLPGVSEPPMSAAGQYSPQGYTQPTNPAASISRSRAIEASSRLSDTPAIARPGTSLPNPNALPSHTHPPQAGKGSKLLFWKKAAPSTTSAATSVDGAVPWPAGSFPGTGLPEGGAPAGSFPAGEAFPIASSSPRLWQRQPYSVIAHILAMAGTVTGGWFFGLLVAQLLPGNITQPPLQEALLRKSSRLAHSLWHLPALWQTPTAQTRIEAIPLPETGPVLAPVALPPIERQPLIDELNAIETEIITLDRRLQGLEKKLGRPPYQGTDIDSRVNALRRAIDPLPRTPNTRPSYTPTPRNPVDALLDVAELKITIPSDALFAPGQDQLKEAALLQSVLDQLVNYPEATIVIRSYSDNQASAFDSRGYTLKQANALRAYLKMALPSTHRWVSVGAGLSQPIVSNDSEASRQQNRRIEILVDTR